MEKEIISRTVLLLLLLVCLVIVQWKRFNSTTTTKSLEIRECVGWVVAPK
jgi:DNA-binding transcriptional regulator of glucitol operon